MIHRKCRACGASIVFIGTPGGKSMPCDDYTVYYKQTPDGKETFITPNGETVKGERSNPQNEDVTGIAYVPHWATCKNPDKFRRRGK